MMYTKLNNLRSFGLDVLEALTLSRWSGMICLFVLLCLGNIAKAEEYNLYIAGTQVTSDNATNILGDGKVSYDASKNTLTIKGDITAPDEDTPCISGGIDYLIINVAVRSTLRATKQAIYLNSKKTTITGSKQLSVYVTSDDSEAIVQKNGNLVIDKAELSVNHMIYFHLSNMSVTDSKLMVGDKIWGFGGNMDITNSTVMVMGSGGISSPGGTLSIDNSNVLVYSQNEENGAIWYWADISLTGCYLLTPQGGSYDKNDNKLKTAEGKAATSVVIVSDFTTDADGIHYNVTSPTTVEVIKPKEGKYSGAITIPATVTYDESTFQVTAISDYAFQESTVTSVTLPLTNLTSIGSFAFNDCTGLTEFTLPECITSIGERAFYYCDKLQHLYVHSSDPSSYHAGSMAFSSINRAGNVCTLHVPTGTTAAYTADNSPFQAFTKVEEFTKYDLFVAGTLVTSLNAKDVLGDGVARYDASKNTLSVSDDITAPDAGTPCIKSGIEGLTINVTAPAELKATDQAIYLSNTATITGSSQLTISVSSDDDQATAIFQKDGDIYVTDANLSAVGLMWCIGGKIDITNTTISNLGGIYCFSSNTNITNITNSTVSVNGIHGIGIVGFGALRIDNSTVNATIPDPSSAIGLWGAVTLSNCYYKTPQGGYYDDAPLKRVLVDAEGNLATTVEIVPGEDPYLYIAGKCVTSKNASDILGNGVASYDEDTKTLTISGNITAPDDDTPCIKSGVEGLTIQVAAPSELRATNEAIYLQGSNTTITGTSLVVGGKICCPDGNLNIFNSTLACLGDITGGGVLEISKSTVSATSSDSEEPVIAGWKSLTLIGCSLSTPEGGYYNTENKMLVDANGDFAPVVMITNGDASGDGKVDEKDMISIIQYLLGERVGNFDINAADLNGDHQVTITDLLLLMERLGK